MAVRDYRPRLREQLTIFSQVQRVDESGNIETVWIAVATIFGKMTPVGDREITRAGRDEGFRDFQAIVRYRVDITTKTRIVWRGRNFDVQGVTNLDEQRQYLTLSLLERRA